MEDLVLSCLESRVEDNRNLYARFLVGPFFKGDALTVATALRRVLLSSVESVAITALYIQGITHEFSNIVGVRESVLELSLNFQSIVLCYDKRFFQKKDFFDDIQIGYLQVQGPKVVYANDLKLPLGVKVVDPTQYIATISREGVLVLKFTLGKTTNSHLLYPSPVKGMGIPSSFHSTLRATKQAISQQLLKKNIVKAKTRCSYKRKYAGNPKVYCYPSIKQLVRVAYKSSHLVKRRSGEQITNMQSSAKPLNCRFPRKFNAITQQKEWAAIVQGQKNNIVVGGQKSATQEDLYSIWKTFKQGHVNKHKKQIDHVRVSENGASKAPAVKAVHKAKSFFHGNSYVKRENLRRPFCKFKENGGNDFTESYPQSFFYNANKVKCKLIKPKKKEKSHTNKKQVHCVAYRSNFCTPSLSVLSESLTNSICKQRKTLGFTRRFFCGYKRLQKSVNSRSNYNFNKSVNYFKDKVFQSDICLHNIIPLESSLSPVLKVNFLVEIDDDVLYLRQKVRERIILEVWTNGSIHPRQALHDATLSLLDIFSSFRSIYQTNQYSSTFLKVPEYNKR